MKKIPLLKFVIPFVTGIIIGDKFGVNILYSSIILILFLSTCIVSVIKNKSIPQNIFFSSIIYLSIFFSGLLFISINSSSKIYLPDDWKMLKNVEVYGTINNIDLIKKGQVNFNIISDSIKSEDSSLVIQAKLISILKSDNIKEIYSKIYPGNRISIKGFLRTSKKWSNPGEPDFASYYHYKEISGTIYCYNSDEFKILNEDKYFISSFFFNIRKYLDAEIKKLHLPETAALIRGFILADRSDIDPDVNEAFINTGVVHILSVSGLHVSYIVLLFLLLFSRFNVKAKYIITAIGLILFLFLTGFQPPVVRSVIMGVIIIITYLNKRSTNLINSILIAGFVIIIFDVYSLFDRGFILSFLCILALAIFFQPLQEIIHLKTKNRIIANFILFVSMGLIVQIGILPFILFYYHKVSFIVFITNLAAIPLTGAMLGISFVTLIANIFSPFFASIFANANDLLTIILYNFIKYFSNPEYSVISINHFSSFDITLFYIFIGLGIIIYKLKFNLSFKLALIPIIIFIFFFIISLDNVDILKKNYLNVMMIDVGEGDAFLIKFPNGKTALVDAGDASGSRDSGEKIIMPLMDRLNLNKIDYAFISHLDKDHYSGLLSLVVNKKVNFVYKPHSDKDSLFEKLLNINNIGFSYYENNYLDFGNSRIYVLQNPNTKYNNENDGSAVLKLVYGKTSFLFTGDISTACESKYVMEYGDFLKANVLKVSHHGSGTSSSEKFLETVNPEMSLVSVGYKNKYGHPDKETIDRLKIHAQIFRTDFEGAVVLRSDGEHIEKINWQSNY